MNEEFITNCPKCGHYSLIWNPTDNIWNCVLVKCTYTEEPKETKENPILKFEEYLENVLEDMKEILIKKNTGYGNSFFETMEYIRSNSKMFYDHYRAFFQRVYDKLKRFYNLTEGKISIMEDWNKRKESMKDVVIDIIGYSLLMLIYMEKLEGKLKIKEPNLKKWLEEMLNE